MQMLIDHVLINKIFNAINECIYSVGLKNHCSQGRVYYVSFNHNILKVSVSPNACKVLLVGRDSSFSMFLAFIPLAIIDLSIRISHHSFSTLLTINIMAFIYASISPAVDPIAMLFAFSPFSIICITVFALISQFSIKVVILEISTINVSRLVERSFPIFLIVQKLPDVSRLVRVSGLSITIRNIIFPLAFEPKAFFANIYAIAISNIVFEVSIIIASISFDKSTLSFASSIYENSLKKVVIAKVQFSISMRFLIKRLAHIFSIQVFQVQFFLRNHQVSQSGSLSSRKISIGIFHELAINSMILVTGNFVQP